MRIGIDLDGCAYDFTTSFLHYLECIDHPRAKELPHPDRWDIWECWGMTEAEWFDLFEAGVASGYIFRTGAPIQAAPSTITDLRDEGHTIHIVTYRKIHPRAVQSTGEWLHEQGLKYDSLTFSADKTAVPVDIFIEDNVENADALRDAGVYTILYDQPWNQHGDHRRVGSWIEFANVVRDLALVS